MPSARAEKCSQSCYTIMSPNLVSIPKFLKKRPKGTDAILSHIRFIRGLKASPHPLGKACADTGAPVDDSPAVLTAHFTSHMP